MIKKQKILQYKKNLKNLKNLTNDKITKFALDSIDELKNELKKITDKKKLTKSESDFQKLLIMRIEIKERIENIATKDEMNAGFNKVLSAIDNLSKKVEDNKIEMASNVVAHDRFNNNFVKIKKELKMESLETIEPFLV